MLRKNTTDNSIEYYDGTSWVDLTSAGAGDMVLADVQTVTGAKTFNSGTLITAGATSGTTTLNATAVAGTTTLTLPAITDTLITKTSTDTLTNKTFDANGTGNSLSNVDVADLANGTDGELITWDAAGAPATVAAGTSGHVLTSNGAGAAPTFQAAAGGGATTLISSLSLSGSAGVFTSGIDSTYDRYTFVGIGITVSVDFAKFDLRTSSNGGVSYDSGASDYDFGVQEFVLNSGTTIGINPDGDNAHFALRLIGNSISSIGNAADEGIQSFVLDLFNPSDTAQFKRLSWEVVFGTGNSNETVITRGGGSRRSTSIIDAVEFSLNTGVFNSGNIYLYGWNLS
jgi:hypothetical protein